MSDGPVIKTWSSNAGVQVWSLVRELSSHVPCGQQTKTQNRNTIVTNAINILKMIHIKKKKKRTGLYFSVQELPSSESLSIQWTWRGTWGFFSERQSNNTNTNRWMSPVCSCGKLHAVLHDLSKPRPWHNALFLPWTSGIIMDLNVSWDPPASRQKEVLLSTNSRHYHY